MATKKVAAKKSTALVPWNEKFAKYAKEGKDQIKNVGTGGLGVKFGRGSISIGGIAVQGGKLECVLIGSCALNKYYKEAYDPDNATPPDCYAFALITDDPEMRPHEQAADKQSDLCSTCEQNEFGTAKIGKGKACNNTIRLGLITAKDAEDAAGISTAELGTGGVSPTNLKNYAGYIKALEEEHGRPVWAVVTEISSHDDPKTQIRLEFKMVALIEDDDILEALEKRFLKVQDTLQQPFAAATEKKAPAKKSNQKFAAKKPAGRR